MTTGTRLLDHVLIYWQFGGRSRTVSRGLRCESPCIQIFQRSLVVLNAWKPAGLQSSPHADILLLKSLILTYAGNNS